MKHTHRLLQWMAQQSTRRVFTLAFVTALHVPLVHAFDSAATVAIVENEVITGLELQKEAMRIALALREANGSDPTNAEVMRRAIDEAIKKRLVLQRADSLGLEISDMQLRSVLTQIASRNNISLEQLPELVQSQGINFDTYIEEIRDQVRIQSVQERVVARDAQVTELDVDQFIQRNPQFQGDGTQYQFWLATLPANLVVNDNQPELLDELKAIRKRFDAGEYRSQYPTITIEKIDTGNAQLLPRLVLQELERLRMHGAQLPASTDIFRSEQGFHVLQLISTDTRSVDAQQYRYGQIMIAKRSYPSEARALEAAEGALKAIQDGVEFDVIAARYSDDRASAFEGGDVGWVAIEEFPSSFREPISQLSVGEVTDVLDSGFSFHLIKLTQTREMSASLAIRQSARVQLVRERERDAFNRWVETLMADAYIEIIDPEIGAIYP